MPVNRIPTTEEKITVGPVLTPPQYAVREIIHTGFGIGIAVLVAVALEVQGTMKFDKALLDGILVTAARTAATAIITGLSRYVVK